MPIRLFTGAAVRSDAARNLRDVEPYRVPFLFDRTRAPVYRLVNISAERLRGVTVALAGSGVMSPVMPGTLEPAQAIELRVRGAHLERDATLMVRWLRPSGEEYLWRVCF
jgi:hypothetical protein